MPMLGWGWGSNKDRQGRLLLWLALQALGTLGTFVPASVVFDWSAGPLVEFLFAVVAAGLFAFHLVNIFETRTELGHWGEKSLVPLLRSEIAVGCALPLTIFALALSLPPTWWALVVLGVAFFAAHSIYEPLEKAISRRAKAAGKPLGTTYFSQRKPLRFARLDADIAGIAEGDPGPGIWGIFAVLLGPDWQTDLSRTRSVILCIMLTCVGLACAAAADVAVHDQIVRHHAMGKSQVNRKYHGSYRWGKNGSGGNVSGGRGSSQDSGSNGSAKPSRCRFEPDYGAPLWAKADLDALYFGEPVLDATAPPGTQAGGCPTRAVVPTRLHGTFVYTIGRNEQGEVRSIALDSLRFGPAIFLAPAAQRVIALIRNGVMPLGGYPTVEVGGGDMAPITTPRGTIMLVRPEKHLLGRPEFATPYVELPPTVTTAWVVAMRERESWLWPLTPRVAGALTEFPFAALPSGDPAVEVGYEPRSGLARLGPYSYIPPQPQASRSELDDYAKVAR